MNEEEEDLFCKLMKGQCKNNMSSSLLPLLAPHHIFWSVCPFPPEMLSPIGQKSCGWEWVDWAEEARKMAGVVQGKGYFLPGRSGGGGAKNGRCCPRERLFSAGQIGWRRREKWRVVAKGKVIFCPMG
jgi:hypothetical protein